MKDKVMWRCNKKLKWLFLFLTFSAVILLSGCSTFKEHILLKKGNALYKKHNYMEAVRYYEDAKAVYNGRSETFRNIAYCYFALYEPGSTQQRDIEYSEKAINAFRSYLDMESNNHPPDFEKVQDYLINLYISSQKLDEGIEYYKTLYDKDQKNLKFLQALSTLYIKKGDAKTAMEFQQLKTDLTPNDNVAYETLGALCWAYLFYQCKECPPDEKSPFIDRGLAAIEHALKLKNDSFTANLYYNLMLRQKAGILPAAEKDEIARLTAEADEYKEKAKAIRDAEKAKQLQAIEKEPKK